MKKLSTIILLISLILCICACNGTPKETQWWEQTHEQTETDTAAPDSETTKPSPIAALFGAWKNEHGEPEPIDENSVGGSRYTIKEATQNAYGDITATLIINDSEVVYTVYRYVCQC